MILFFGLYPLLYNILANSPLGKEASLLLPSIGIMISIFYFGLFAMSFDFISGYTGYLSFGHAAFYGIGAYFVILIAKSKFYFLDINIMGFEIQLLSPNTPLILNIIFVGLLAALIALVVGVFAFRLTNVYFAIITLAFSHVMYIFMSSWKFVSSNPAQGATVPPGKEAFEVGVPFIEKIGLELGPVSIDIPLSFSIGQLKGGQISSFFGINLADPVNMSYYVIGILVVISYFAMQRIIHSPFGRVMIAIRENEERAEAVGYNTFRYKLGAFAISAFFAAVAGGLLAGYKGSVSPDNTFYFLVTGEALLAAIIGGLGTLVGPLFGRGLHEGVRDILSTGTEGLAGYLESTLSEGILSTNIGGFSVQDFVDSFLSGHENFFIGLLFIIFVISIPDGIIGRFRKMVGGKFSKQVNPFKKETTGKGESDIASETVKSEEKSEKESEEQQKDEESENGTSDKIDEDTDEEQSDNENGTSDKIDEDTNDEERE